MPVVYSVSEPLKLNSLECIKPLNSNGDVIYIFVNGEMVGSSTGYSMQEGDLSKLRISVKVLTTARIELKTWNGTSEVSLGRQIFKNGSDKLLFQKYQAKYSLVYSCSY